MIQKTLLTLVSSLLLTVSVQADECTYRRSSPVFESTDFSPLVTDEAFQITPQLETNATLFRRGQNGDLIPELGQSFEIDYEAKKLIVSLNPNCGWSDGTNITAHDYVEGLRLLFRPEAKDTYIPGRELFKQAKRILSGEFPPSALGARAEGPHTVVFDLVAPPDMLMIISSYVSMTPAPTHLIEQDPSAWPTSSLQRVSSGPFVVVEQNKDRIVLEPNQYYCKGYQYGVNRIELINEHKPIANFNLIKEGKLDVAEGLSKQQTEALHESHPDIWLTTNMSEKMIQYLHINNKDLVDKPDIRQALLSSIDREIIVNEVLKKDYIYPYDSLNFHYRDYQNATIGKAYQGDYGKRIQRAQAIMKQHGYGPNKRLGLSLGYYDYDELVPIVTAFRDMLSQIYVDLSLERTDDFQSLFDRDLTIAGWFADFDDPFNTLSAFAQRIQAQAPALIKAVEQTNNVFDHQQRFAALSALDQQLIDSDYFLPLFLFTIPLAVGPEMSFGEERYPLGRNASKENCYLSQQRNDY